MESVAHIDVVIEEVADELENIIGGKKEEIVAYIHEKIHQQGQPIKAGILVAPLLFNEIEQPEMMITRGNIRLNNDMINGFIVLADDNSRSDRHLQLLSQLEHTLKDPDFKKKWHKAETAEDIKKLFIQDVRTLSVRITDSGKTAQLEGKKLKEIDLPDHVLAAVVYREGKMTIPNAETVLRPGDEVTFIADGKAMQALIDELKE